MVPEERPLDPLSVAPALDVDEDLFDFPAVGADFDPLASLDASLDDALDEELPLDELDAVTLDAETAHPAPEPEPLSADGNHFADLADLDEDIFDFDEVFLAASAPPDGVAPDPFDFDDLSDEPPVAALAAVAVAQADPAPGDPAAPRPATAAPRPPTPARESTSPRPAQPAPSRALDFDPSAPPVFPPDLVLPAKRGRMLELMGVAFLVLNTALILFAWRAGDDFRATLVQVTGAITQAVSEGQARAGSAQPIVIEMPAPAAAADSDPNQDPLLAKPLERTVLEIAHARLEAGEFEDARRGLFAMLAGQDRAALPEHVVAEAELLVARSYYLQGKAVREDN